MKNAVVILAVGLVALGAFYFYHQQTAREQLTAVRAQVVATSNLVVEAQKEVGAVKEQLVQQAGKTSALEKQVVTLGTEKARTEQQLQQARQEAAELQKKVAAEQDQITTMETEKQRLTGQLTTVNGRLATVQKELAELQETHRGTVKDIEALRDEKEALEMAKASLERRMNDLGALRDQIRYVKQQMWEQKVAEWKKAYAVLTAAGNKGFLFQQGQWRSVGKPAQP